MRRLLTLVALALCVQSCTTTLYYWGGGGDVSTYEKLSYRYFDTQSPESVCELVCMYERMVNEPGGSRMIPPPGVCAEYGYLLMQPSTLEAFEKHATKRQRKLFGSDVAASFRNRGMEMLKMEMALYPESQKFIAPLLNRF